MATETEQARADTALPVIAEFPPEVLHAVYSHGAEERRREIGGVLIGDHEETPVGHIVRVFATIRAEYTEAAHTHVTFTHQTWEHVHAELERRYPGKTIVGWYHSHPGLGLFLSGMDRFICNNFFNLPWHLAMVVDPVAGNDVIFGRRDGELVPMPAVSVLKTGPHPLDRWGVYFCAAGRGVPTRATEDSGVLDLTGGSGEGAIIAPAPRPPRPPRLPAGRRARLIWVGAVLVALIAVGGAAAVVASTGGESDAQVAHSTTSVRPASNSTTSSRTTAVAQTTTTGAASTTTSMVETTSTSAPPAPDLQPAPLEIQFPAQGQTFEVGLDVPVIVRIQQGWPQGDDQYRDGPAVRLSAVAEDGALVPKSLRPYKLFRLAPDLQPLLQLYYWRTGGLSPGEYRLECVASAPGFDSEVLYRCSVLVRLIETGSTTTTATSEADDG